MSDPDEPNDSDVPEPWRPRFSISTLLMVMSVFCVMAAAGSYLVRSLKLLCPTLGKVRIAQVLARAGLHLGATTVGRMLRGERPKGDAVAEEAAGRGRAITARYPNHVWHVDLTVVPTLAGFWLPWMPSNRRLSANCWDTQRPDA